MEFHRPKLPVDFSQAPLAVARARLGEATPDRIDVSAPNVGSTRSGQSKKALEDFLQRFAMRN
jgi:hypothetical protein